MVITIIAGTFLVLTQGNLLLSKRSESSITNLYIEQAAIEEAIAQYNYNQTQLTEVDVGCSVMQR